MLVTGVTAFLMCSLVTTRGVWLTPQTFNSPWLVTHACSWSPPPQCVTTFRHSLPAAPCNGTGAAACRYLDFLHSDALRWVFRQHARQKRACISGNGNAVTTLVRELQPAAHAHTWPHVNATAQARDATARDATARTPALAQRAPWQARMSRRTGGGGRGGQTGTRPAPIHRRRRRRTARLRSHAHAPPPPRKGV